MSIPLVPHADDQASLETLARAVVPVVVAVAVTALMLVAVRAQPVEDRDAKAAPASTAYSEMHSSIPQPAEPEEQPPTF